MTLNPHSLLDLADTIHCHLSALPPTDPIHTCGSSVTSILPSNPQAVIELAHRKLHAYPFKDVPVCWRRAYEEGCLWKVVLLLRSVGSRAGDGEGVHGMDGKGEGAVEMGRGGDWVKDVVEICDMALILTGAPGRREVIDAVLVAVDEPDVRISGRKLTRKRCGDGTTHAAIDDDYHTLGANDYPSQQPSKRRRLSRSSSSSSTSTSTTVASPRSPDGLSEHTEPIGTFPASASPIPILTNSLPRLSQPALTAFTSHMHKNRTPVILTSTLTHWPALKRWPDPSYWLERTHGGRRLVPVEVGRSYTDEGWGQRIMGFREFLEGYLMDGDGGGGDDGEGGEKGYLAQHDLLTQIPALRNDIMIPEYCYLEPPPPAIPPAIHITSNINHDSTLETFPDKPANTHNTSSHKSDTNTDSTPKSQPTHTISNEEVPSDEEEAEEPPSEPQLNIWLGPSSTISPAHTDPHHNILCQVFGRKYVRLFSPSQTSKMYPMGRGGGVERGSEGGEGNEGGGGDGGKEEGGVDMANTSSVDVSAYLTFFTSPSSPSTTHSSTPSDLEIQREIQNKLYPLHATASYTEAILEPGDALYIPRDWWHYVRSLSVGCSVSFWWD